MRSPRRIRQNSDEDSQQSEDDEEEPTPRNFKNLQANDYSPPESPDSPKPKPRKKSEKFETELAGHSE